MAIATQNIELVQGMTFREQIILYQGGTLTQDEIDRLTVAEVQALSKVDLNGATIEAKLRERFDDATSLADFTIENRVDSTGTFDLVMVHTVTDTLDFERALYDIEIAYGGTDKRRELQGIVTFNRGVTY